MDVPCPRCNSSGLQKVSLAYEEGLYQSDKRAQFRGVLIASGGPGVLVGTSTTKGTSRGAPGLSKPARILPPDRCCRLPLVIWGGIAINYSLRRGENVCFATAVSALPRCAMIEVSNFLRRRLTAEN